MRTTKAAAVAAVLCGTMLAGCVDSPTNAMLTFNKGPVASSGPVSGSKRGEASAYQVLGLIAFGDASLATAAKKGGITKINSADRECTNILGIFSTYTLVVTGE